MQVYALNSSYSTPEILRITCSVARMVAAINSSPSSVCGLCKAEVARSVAVLVAFVVVAIADCKAKGTEYG